MRYRTEVRDVNIVNSSISVGGVVLMPVKTQEYAKLSMGYGCPTSVCQDIPLL